MLHILWWWWHRAVSIGSVLIQRSKSWNVLFDGDGDYNAWWWWQRWRWVIRLWVELSVGERSNYFKCTLSLTIWLPGLGDGFKALKQKQSNELWFVLSLVNPYHWLLFAVMALLLYEFAASSAFHHQAFVLLINFCPLYDARWYRDQTNFKSGRSSSGSWSAYCCFELWRYTVVLRIMMMKMMVKKCL